MKKIDWKKIKLTKEEQEIEDNAEKFIPLSPGERARMERALEKARKEATISLRMTEQDLWEIKQKALEEGMPYQTFIGSILHKYLGRQLVDRAEVEDIVGMIAHDRGRGKYKT